MQERLMMDSEVYKENWNEQISEIVALRSILGLDFRLTGGLSEQDFDAIGEFTELLEFEPPDPPTTLFCQAIVYVDIPTEGLELTVIKSCSSSQPQSCNPVKIHHLPALCLDLELNPLYPVEEKAEFRLSCSWLSTQQLSKIADELDRIWSEQPGTQICFSWIDWLHTDLLESLGIANNENRIILDQSRPTQTDFRVSLGNEEIPVDRIFANLVEYNNIQTRNCFEKESWTCPICMTGDSGKNFILFQPCGDYFCKDCFSQYCSVKIKDGQVNFDCPGHGCKTPVPPGILKQSITLAEFDRWENLLLKRTLEMMSDIKYCPKCSTACIEEPGSFSQCPKCYFSFCTRCCAMWHPGSECISLDDKIKKLEATLSEEEEEKFKQDTLRLARELENQVLSLNVIEKETKPCPVCGMAIQKNGGCNHMMCIYCKTHYCHNCRRAIYDGYNHFQEGNCVLFPVEAIQEWEREINALEVEQPEEEEAENEPVPRRQDPGFDRMIRCGNCRAVNYKMDKNNHIRCYVCSANICFLCRQILPRKNAIAHFQSGRCEQHTDL